MTTESTLIIAFEQHAASVVAAVLAPAQRIRCCLGLAGHRRFVDRLARQGNIRCCYQAGPWGFELQRSALTSDG